MECELPPSKCNRKETGNWSVLPRDLLSAIARRLVTAADGARFSGVCQNWSSLAKSEITNLPCNPPWLMLTEKPDSNDRDFVCTNGKHFSLELPKGRGSRCIGSNGCWVIMMDKDFDIYILNPFSGVKIDLPSWRRSSDNSVVVDPPGENTFDLRDFYAPKMILLFPNSKSPIEDDFIVVVKYALSTQLAYTRKGAKYWQVIESIHNVESVHNKNNFLDVIFYQDKCYAVNQFGIILEFNVNCSIDEKPIAVPISDPLMDTDWPKRHLVEFQGLLLQVVNLISTTGFQVFKLDFTSGGWVELNDLGQHSIFLGYYTGISLFVTSKSTFKPNCIYFSTEEFVKTRVNGKRSYIGTMGVFDLSDSIILPYYKGTYSGSEFNRPVWIVPTSLSQNQ